MNPLKKKRGGVLTSVTLQAVMDVRERSVPRSFEGYNRKEIHRRDPAFVKFEFGVQRATSTPSIVTVSGGSDKQALNMAHYTEAAFFAGHKQAFQVYVSLNVLAWYSVSNCLSLCAL